MTNTPERQPIPNREVTDIKKSLFDSVKDFFKRNQGNENMAKDYLESQSKKSAGKLTPEQKSKHTQQKSKIDNLKNVIRDLSVATGQNFSQAIIEKAQSAASELSEKANRGFQTSFYKKLANIEVADEYALPFARYILESADTVSGENMKASAKQKTALALEIFVGETGNTSNLGTLKKVIRSIYDTHNDRDVQQYFSSEEFSELCQDYGLSKDQAKELIDSRNTEQDENELVDSQMDLEADKNKILDSTESPEDRVSLDIELLSLSSDRILTLLRTVEQDMAENVRGVYGSSDKEKLERLNDPIQIERLTKSLTVKKWIDDYLKQHNLTGEKADKTKKQVMDYYLKFRNRVYLEKMRRHSRQNMMYGGYRDPYQQWIDKLDDNIIAADLMLAAFDPFLYNEYFKGQTAAAIVKNDQVGKAIESVKNKKQFAISDDMIYGDILKDLKQGYLAEMSQEGDRNYSELKRNISEGINKMKMAGKTKEHVFFGQVQDRKNNEGDLKIAFLYSHYTEGVSEGGEFTEQGFYSDPTFAHMTAVYPKAMEGLKSAYGALNEIVTIAESKGDGEGLTEASGKITNDLLDAVSEQAPLAYVAMQSYLRIIRQKLASNGMVLTPDMFGDTSYVKSIFSKELEMEVKNPYGNITDFEKDVFLKMGMGLAFASGEMQSILANALPPMSLKIEKLPPSILKKIKNGENLTIKEQKALEGEFAPTFRDFKYRGLLMNVNPLMWLHTWVKYNDYQIFNLGFNPLKTGKSAIDPLDNFGITQNIMMSTFLGLSEDVVEYFDGTYRIPAIYLARMNQKMSMEKRGGVREKVKQLLAKDFEVYTQDGLQRVNGNSAFKKLMEQSPVLAYSLLTDKHIADHADVYWEIKGETVKTENLSKEFKEKKIGELLEYMHKYYPTFFTSIEQPMHFRRKELSFSQSIKEKILTDLRAVQDRKSGYWLLLNEKEADQAIAQNADIHPLGQKHMHENIIGTKRVNERMNIIMMELQTYLQEKGDRTPSNRKNLMDFVRQNGEASYDEGMSGSLDKAVDNIINTFFLQPKDKKDIRQMFIQYAKDVYYGQSEGNNNSIYNKRLFLGNTKLNKHDSDLIKKENEDKEDKKGRGFGLSISDEIINRNGHSIKDYYAKLINDNIIIDPFDWAYLDQTQLNFQATGLKMAGRHLGDYSHAYLPYGTQYMKACVALQDAISQPEQSKKLITDALDGFSESIHEINSVFSPKEAAEAGWMATAYLTYPFTTSRWKDMPLAGKLPLLHSWATMVNHADKRHNGAWDSKTRKEVVDHVLQKPWSKAILDSLQDNKEFKGLRSKLKILGKEVTIPKPLRGLFSRVFEDRFKEGSDGDYSVKSLKSFLKVEDWWTGGKENFGIGYNTLMTVLLIGFLLMLFQAIKEGMKEVEIK